jgi:micrococcal nuclease
MRQSGLGIALLLLAAAVAQAGETTAPTPATAPLELASPGRSARAVVTRVIDGDTIDVRLPDGRPDRVRYIGINTPDLHHPRKGREPGAEAARQANRRLVQGKVVDLAFDVRVRDRYGRLLAYVWAEGRHVNAELVSQGYAAAATHPPNVRYAEEFRRLEQGAREAGRGLWRTSAP